MTHIMKDLVQIQGGFKPSVLLPDDFYDERSNQHFVSTYIPTQETLAIFMNIRDSLQAGSEHRAHLFSGTYGTGKSDLMLMIANYVTRDPNDPLLQSFFERLGHLNHSKAEAIRQARLGRPPFLLVLLESHAAVTFSSFVLDGLIKTLERVDLLHLMKRTYYRAALELIQSWEPYHLDNYQHLGQVLEQDYGMTLDGLKQDLDGPRADSALEVFRPAVEKAIGMPFHPTAVIQRPADAFVEVVKRLVDDGQYSGVFVICDEFTHLLQQLAESPTAADSKAIDNLAELAVRSGRQQLHFIVVSLESFASAQGSTQLAQKSLERSGGRFIQRELKSQDVEELISASIAKLVPTGQLFQGSSLQQDDLLTLAMKLWGEREERRRDRTWVQQTVVHGAFPLHPLATYCLQRLNAALAQNERTMFSFLWDQEHGLNHFIQTASAEPSATGWLPLMALADLFAYFEPNLKEKRPDLLLAYNQARSNLGTEWLAAGLEDKILCALVLLEVVSDPALHPDRTLLRHALALAPADEPKLDDALSQLEQALVAYKDQTGRYRLVLPGRANPLELKRLIDKRARELPGSPLELLNNLHGLQPIGAGAYNRDRGTSRQLTARFISPAGLASPATLDTDLQEQDGLAWYVVAASEQELKAARAEALQLTRENDRLAVAVPRQPTNLVACFKGKRALEALRYSSEYQSTDAQDLLRDTGLIGEDYVKAFQRARVFFDNPGNFDWFRKGRTVDVHNPQHLDALVSAMMKDVFPQTPVHGIPQHLKPSGSSKNLQDAVNCLLQAPFQLEPTRRGKKSPKDAILREGAEPLGLIAHVGDSAGYETFDAVPPEKTPPYSYEVWMAIENSLRAGADWQAIVRLLTERPYGLYPSVLQLFTAAFYQVNRDFLEVYEAGKSELRPIDLTAQAVEKLVDEPEKYTIRYQPLTDLQRRYLRGLAERALFPGMHLRDMGSTGAALRNRTAQALRVWWAEQQQGVCRIAGQATADELACVLTNSPPETLQAAVALLRAAQQANVSMTASVLLAELPGHIGLPSDIQGWTNDQVEQALAILESTCAVLKSFPKNFKAHVAWQVGQSFGLEAPPTDCNDALEAALSWRAQLPSGVHSTRLTDQDARDLIHVLDDEPDSFEQAFLNALPYRMRLLTYENWKTMSVCDQYLGRLSKAKGCVEQMAAQVVQLHTTAAPTPTPTTPSAPSGTPPPQVAAEPPAVGTAVAAKAKEGPVPAAVTTATTTAIHGPTTTPPPEASSPTVEQAFAQVHLIFEGLTPLDRQALLQKLRQWYECP